MHRIHPALRWTGTILLWAIVAVCLTLTVIPHLLDRVYYRGAVTSHFDGEHFSNPDGDDDRLKTTGGRSRIGFMWRQAFGDAERPVWPEKVAVTPSKPAPRVDDGRMVVTWVGHATVLVQANGLNILTDPIWSETAGPFGVGPRRVTDPGVRFEDLPRIDLVLVSHNHYDHLDLATLKRLWDRDRPLIVTSLGNDSVIGQAGVPATALDWGGRIAVRSGIEVAVTRNHHWGSRWFSDRNRALWSSFVVRMPGGNFFFAGDTGLGDGKWPAEAAALGSIRFAAIPIGAFRFEEGQMRNGSHISPPDAIRVWDGLGRPRSLAIHWGTFRLSREARETPPDMLHGMMDCAGSDPARFGASGIGEAFEVAPLSAAPPPPDLAALDACEKGGAFRALR
ncbi:MBL fold metallo-hydrolase [Sphingomonas sp. G-3-2-10]|uniref:MBL fold metallo-hydrolase n=1 Tax=Sphingomonas sp. G-3-2-10 TaxID=2728838 RepID=UPI00146BB4BD|nr:MBL fold metallo-hydrolase [Sphingomonas sp. G-3-2-10]NML07556.1 Zn-dependent hydrolase [Sphingomonas sp. G-3-2-10]